MKTVACLIVGKYKALMHCSIAQLTHVVYVSIHFISVSYIKYDKYIYKYMNITIYI